MGLFDCIFGKKEQPKKEEQTQQQDNEIKLCYSGHHTVKTSEVTTYPGRRGGNHTITERFECVNCDYKYRTESLYNAYNQFINARHFDETGT